MPRSPSDRFLPDAQFARYRREFQSFYFFFWDGDWIMDDYGNAVKL